MAYCLQLLAITAVFAALGCSSLASPVLHYQAAIDDRLAVIRNKAASPNDFTFAFDSNGGKLRFKQSTGKDGWSEWNDLGSPANTEVISNPSAAQESDNLTSVFVLTADGQVYTRKQHTINAVSYSDWMAIGSKLSADKGTVLYGKDNVVALNYLGKMTVFTRSLTNTSHLYWSQKSSGKWSAWSMIGGSSALLTDVAVVYNPFSKYMEAFAVMTDKKMYRTWQTGAAKWVSWDKTGYSAPTSVHAPVVHSMSGNVFNGRLNVFLFGEDGSLHHIWQTTCDKVPNPWGWCTWSLWYKIGNPIPSVTTSANPLSIGANIHNGIEVFTVSKEGGLWHLWELERGADWSSWQYVGRPKTGAMATHAAIVNDEKGWWAAYTVGAKDEIELIEQNRSMTLSTGELPSGKPITVTWSVPEDEATSMDWIGVYPSGKENSFYVDFYYIGGGQNPTKGARPKGSLTFRTFLPKGSYEYRYLANKKYFDAMRVPLTVTAGPQGKEWVQVYHGIAIGLGKENISFDQCVEDGNQTVAAFKAAFEAFDNRQVWRGMQLIGQALVDVYKAFEACGETDIAKALEKLAMDFVKCTESNCVKFAIDAIDEILILFENIYEIYGDVKGASNAFKIDAYEQGGYEIGRVIAVCISIPNHN